MHALGLYGECVHLIATDRQDIHYVYKIENHRQPSCGQTDTNHSEDWCLLVD